VTSIGFDKPLYMLPFDHRGSFQTQMFGWTGVLTAEQTAQIASTKQVIYDAFQAAIGLGVPKDKAGILGERSGQEEFDFEYGEEFDNHIEALHPTFCKVLVCHNPGGDKALNMRQSGRLKRLSDYLHGKSQSLFMFELLVPPVKAQLEGVKGDKTSYDLELRPQLMIHAIEQLQNAQVEPDVWKIEGLDRLEDCEKIVAASRQGGRKSVGCIVLGRGEDDLKVRRWLITTAPVPGFIGFAVGRTSFWEPLMGWRQKKVSRKEAVAAIAHRHRNSVDIFEGNMSVAA
jgi:myo-inositol catabolism protein IolC